MRAHKLIVREKSSSGRNERGFIHFYVIKIKYFKPIQHHDLNYVVSMACECHQRHKLDNLSDCVLYLYNNTRVGGIALGTEDIRHGKRAIM